MSSKNGIKKSAKPASKEYKRYPSAYNLFVSDIRDELIAKGVKSTEITKEAAKKWKRLKDKSEYEQRAAGLKAEFLKKHPKPVKVEAPKEEKVARSGYMLFAQEAFPRLVGKGKKIIDVIASEWNGLSQEERKSYIERAAEGKFAFDLEAAIKRGVQPIEFGAGADVD